MFFKKNISHNSEKIKLLIQKNRAKTFFHKKISHNSEIINLLIQKNSVDLSQD